GQVSGEVPRQEHDDNRAGGKSVSGPEPSWCCGWHLVRGGNKCCEAEDTEPRNRPEGIIAVWDVEHVEKHANQHEEGRGGECEMREPAVLNVVRFQYDGETERGGAVDKSAGNAEQKPGREPSRHVGCQRELLSSIGQSQRRKQIKQRRRRRQISAHHAAGIEPGRGCSGSEEIHDVLLRLMRLAAPRRTDGTAVQGDAEGYVASYRAKKLQRLQRRTGATGPIPNPNGWAGKKQIAF